LLDYYDEAQLPDEGDPNYYDRFIIYAMDKLTSGRCDGELNDCLYKCLKLIYGTFSKMPKSIEKSEYIKEKLGLPRDAPVPASCMDKVEDLARNLALDITGDVTQFSKSKADKHATLVLSESHYSVATNPDKQHPSHMDHKQKSLFVYQEDGINNTVTIYNSKKTSSDGAPQKGKILTSTQFQKAKISKSYAFVPVEKNKKTGILETLEEAYPIKNIHTVIIRYYRILRTVSLQYE
jgi:hypothetical protein